MKKACLCVFLCLMMIASALSVSAMDADAADGTVLWHQRYADAAEIGELARVGTSSSATFTASCGTADGLILSSYDSGRGYLILLPTEAGDTWTLEFDFRFADVYAENGSLGVMLTCRGEEPGNISSFTIRPNGTIDDFADLTDEVREQIAAGEWMHVTVPIRHGALSEITVQGNGTSCTAERSSVLVLPEGEIGFIVRSASVNIEDTYLVNGADYPDRFGRYADGEEGAETEPVVTSPETADHLPLMLAAVIFASCAGISAIRKRRTAQRG